MSDRPAKSRRSWSPPELSFQFAGLPGWRQARFGAFRQGGATGIGLTSAQWPWRRPAAAESPSRGRWPESARCSIAAMPAARWAIYRGAEDKRRAPTDMLPPATDAEDRRKA